jgi:hypothetical protein
MIEEVYRLNRDILAFLMRESGRSPWDASLKMELFHEAIPFVAIAEHCGVGLKLAQQLELGQDEAMSAVIENRGKDKPWFELLGEFAREIKLKANPYPPDWPVPDNFYNCP